MKIRLIGVGKMGSAIAKQLENGNELSFYDKKAELSDVASPFEKVDSETVVILAIKPQDLATLEIPKNLPAKYIASVLAGKKVATLQKYFAKVPILRMMPNLAVQYGKGIVALTGDVPKKEVEKLFAPLGLLTWIPEEQFDSITSLTGSGPAFVYTLISAMIDAGVSMGFSKEDASQLVAQMIEGALEHMKLSKKPPLEIVKEITSPNGTTMAGLQVLEKNNVQEILLQTFLAAKNRSIELS